MMNRKYKSATQRSQIVVSCLDTKKKFTIDACPDLIPTRMYTFN